MGDSDLQPPLVVVPGSGIEGGGTGQGDTPRANMESLSGEGPQIYHDVTKKQGCKSGLVKKSKTLVILGIALISTNQRPVFIHCSERFQTILII